jgi:hypothetical protein
METIEPEVPADEECIKEKWRVLDGSTLLANATQGAVFIDGLEEKSAT